jgi:hypothetical protein
LPGQVLTVIAAVASRRPCRFASKLGGAGGLLFILAANLGVFVTREHVRHNKSGITHRGKTRISH